MRSSFCLVMLMCCSRVSPTSPGAVASRWKSSGLRIFSSFAAACAVRATRPRDQTRAVAGKSSVCGLILCQGQGTHLGHSPAGLLDVGVGLVLDVHVRPGEEPDGLGQDRLAFSALRHGGLAWLLAKRPHRRECIGRDKRRALRAPPPKHKQHCPGEATGHSETNLKLDVLPDLRHDRAWCGGQYETSMTDVQVAEGFAYALCECGVLLLHGGQQQVL